MILKKIRLAFSKTRLMFWGVFFLCLLVSQGLNPWAGLPEFSGWSVLGFPLVYYQHQLGIGYSYFNIIFLIIDLVIIYVVTHGIIYAYRQLTKYKILK